MNFDFSEDQKLLQKTARDYLEEHSKLEVARRILESPTPYSAEVWQGAAEMGWLGAAVPEEYGGAGFSRLELVLIAEEVGRALAPIPFSSSVYLATEALLLAGSAEQRKEHLPKLVSGETIGTFALAESPGPLRADRVKTTFESGRLQGTKVPVPDGDVAGLAVVVANAPEGPTLALVDLDGEGVKRTPLEGLDPSRQVARIAFENAPAERLGDAGSGWALAERLLDRAAILMAFEQIGGAERAFEMTKDFIMGRYAFGRPVASFQAVKHRMADLYVKLELARSNAYYGAWALENDADDLGIAACGARVAATDAFDLAATEMVQLHGGVGYTWEYDCHLFYRRCKLLGGALGSASEWREKLIQRFDPDRDGA